MGTPSYGAPLGPAKIVKRHDPKVGPASPAARAKAIAVDEAAARKPVAPRKSAPKPASPPAFEPPVATQGSKVDPIDRAVDAAVTGRLRRAQTTDHTN